MADRDAGAVVVGSGAGATAASADHCGWSVVVLEKGRNHLIDTEPPYAPIRFSNDELKSAFSTSSALTLAEPAPSGARPPTASGSSPAT